MPVNIPWHIRSASSFKCLGNSFLYPEINVFNIFEYSGISGARYLSAITSNSDFCSLVKNGVVMKKLPFCLLTIYPA